MSDDYDSFYSTQTALAHYIPSTFYQRIYVYIAEAFNPTENDPTSNPCRIAQKWCAVSAGEDDAEQEWLVYRVRLEQIASQKALAGDISAEELANIQERLVSAPLEEAAPLLYTIPRETIGVERLHQGDVRPGYPANTEHILVDLGIEETSVEEIDCESLQC